MIESYALPKLQSASLVQVYSVLISVGRSGIDGAVIVTTPPEVSLSDVRKEINFCKKVNVPVLGVIENMSTFICPKCSTHSQIFPAASGGAQKMAQEMGE